MKKILTIALAMLFVTVGVATATDFSLTGGYYVRGTHVSTDNDDVFDGYGTYDHELSLTWLWQIADTTQVTLESSHADGVWLGADAADSFAVDYVWGDHTFGNGGTLSAGFLSGGYWATVYGDSEGAKYRLKWTQPVAFGAVVALVEKMVEGEETDIDVDQYALGVIAKAGAINVEPLFVYIDNEGTDEYTMVFDLGIDAALSDAVSFEAEFKYMYPEVDDATWGIYGQLSYVSGPMTLGIIGAYGSDDFNDGEDFCWGGAYFGDTTVGGKILALTLDYAASEQLSLWGYAGYVTSSSASDTTDYEFSGEAVYSITDAVSYTAGLAYNVNNAATTTRAFEAYHKFAFSF